MKKLTLLLAVALFSLTANAQLSNRAIGLKNSTEQVFKDRYETIKAYAVDKWETDNSMIIYTINKQVDAYFEFMLNDKYKPYKVKGTSKYKYYIEVLGKWSEYVGKHLFTDYQMVNYSLDKHMKNANY